VFFVLSGFLITGSLVAEHARSGGVDLGRFLLRRARRLLPALWLMLLAVCTAAALAFRGELGELRTDVVWTITNSALWDVAVPSSKRFFTSLTVWDDNRDGWTVDETVAAAAELKVLWRAALDSATRLGINHLSVSDQPKADTAIKLVRKADSTTSNAERHQLMSKAAEVLSGIMSITIPRETMRAIELGAKPPELEDPPRDPGPARSE